MVCSYVYTGVRPSYYACNAASVNGQVVSPPVRDVWMRLDTKKGELLSLGS